MSSLAASRADNFYHPPEWDPTKKSRDKFQKSTGHNQYTKHGVIRFELPYDGWCCGCERHIGKGSRFNAKKEQDGRYFSTKIWKFTMKCASCPQEFVIATDPKNSDYDFRSGIRKKDEEYSVDREDGVDERIQDKVDAIYKVGGHAAEQERHDRETNAIYKLERAQDDRKRAATESERFDALVEFGEARRHYDYDANAALRQTMRKRRRDAQALEAEGKKKGLMIPLLAQTDAERLEASRIFGASQAQAPRSSRQAPFRANESKRLLGVTTSSIFGRSSVAHQRDLKPALLATTIPAVADQRQSRKRPPSSSEGGEGQAPALGPSPGLRRKKKKKRKIPAVPLG